MPHRICRDHAGSTRLRSVSGETIDSAHVTVTNAHLAADCCNALMFGSETCGNFTDYRFNHISITGAGRSGLGMVSMDGANICS